MFKIKVKDPWSTDHEGSELKRFTYSSALFLIFCNGFCVYVWLKIVVFQEAKFTMHVYCWILSSFFLKRLLANDEEKAKAVMTEIKFLVSA